MYISGMALFIVSALVLFVFAVMLVSIHHLTLFEELLKQRLTVRNQIIYEMEKRISDLKLELLKCKELTKEENP
jgi:hypothetical protein